MMELLPQTRDPGKHDNNGKGGWSYSKLHHAISDKVTPTLTLLSLSTHLYEAFCSLENTAGRGSLGEECFYYVRITPFVKYNLYSYALVGQHIRHTCIFIIGISARAVHVCSDPITFSRVMIIVVCIAGLLSHGTKIWFMMRRSILLSSGKIVARRDDQQAPFSLICINFNLSLDK